MTYICPTKKKNTFVNPLLLYHFEIMFCLKRLLSCVVLTMAFSAVLHAEINPKPFVIPELKTWTGAEGKVVPSGRIVVKSSKLQGVAQALAADYQEMFGTALTVAKGSVKPGDIVLELKKNPTLGDEGYKLHATSSILISAATEKGAFWGTRTLLQLSEQAEDRSIPCGAATDVPEYRLRGFMIDCGRKFIPLAYLQKLTKMLAYYKMNTLQIHLNDNGFRQFFGDDWDKTQAAFRLESETYPGLTAKDGSYSKKEFIDLQKLAEKNGVTIIPEIDVPAHSLAFTHYKPEIGSKDYGMDHLDLFNPETYTFLDGLFKEYLEGPNPVFRGKRVHIGTDEYSNRDAAVVEKFRAFTDRYIRLVESYGKQAVVWGALTHAKGKTPVKSENVLMHIWYNGFANPADMKEQGYQLVSIPDGYVYIVPAAGYYYDYLNTEYLYNSWTPATIGSQKFEENDPAIEGGMFAVWNDHAGNGISVKDIHHRIFPALQTLAVKCWSGKNTSLPFADYNTRRLSLSEAPGVNEQGRLGKPGTVVLSRDEVKSGETLNAEEIGYNYSVSFKINGEEEAKGTELFRSANAVFYLSDPRNGLLGFERDGYLNTFNYRVEKGKEVTLTIAGNNKSVSLFVDGKLREELGPKTLYVIRERNLANYQVEGAYATSPKVYDPSDRIYYQRTLVFPLRHAGNFRSRITSLEVKQAE